MSLIGEFVSTSDLFITLLKSAVIYNNHLILIMIIDSGTSRQKSWNWYRSKWNTNFPKTQAWKRHHVLQLFRLYRTFSAGTTQNVESINAQII